MSSSPTLRDVWRAVPLAGRVALVTCAGLLALATAVRLTQGDSASAQPAPSTSPSLSRAAVAYQDGYAIGGKLVAGGAAAPVGGQVALQVCQRAASVDPGVQRSLLGDFDQKLDWYRGCADALMRPGQMKG
jgi:hypothetical protein